MQKLTLTISQSFKNSMIGLSNKNKTKVKKTNGKWLKIKTQQPNSHYTNFRKKEEQELL
jgi:hypothetical protein